MLIKLYYLCKNIFIYIRIYCFKINNTSKNARIKVYKCIYNVPNFKRIEHSVASVAKKKKKLKVLSYYNTFLNPQLIYHLGEACTEKKHDVFFIHGNIVINDWLFWS